MNKSTPFTPPRFSKVDELSSAEAIQKLRPATAGLIFLLGLHLSGYAFGGVKALVDWARERPVDVTLLEIGFVVPHAFVMAFMLRSMLQIRRLRNLYVGRIAAAVACVPVVTPAAWLGIPFGIWLSAILWRQDVAAAFQAAAKTASAPRLSPEPAK